MDKTIDIKDWYISNFGEFEKKLNGGKENPLHQKRKEALSNFSRLDFPSIKDEEWKYTSIAPLLKHNFILSYEKKTVSKEFIKSLLFDEMEHSLIVFINGKYSHENSILLNLPKGVIVGSIAEEMKKNSEILLKHFGKYADYQNQIFTALIMRFLRMVHSFMFRKENLLKSRGHVIFITNSPNEKVLSQPRNLFAAEKNSQATIIEHYFGNDGEIYFTNSVTEIVVEGGRRLVWVRREWPARPSPQQEASERLWPMMAWLLDAGPLVALFDRSDRSPSLAVAEWARAPVPLLTCEAVLAEATYLLCEHAGPVAHLLEKYHDQGMQLADACLVRMSELKRDCQVFTLDKEDFRIYRRFERQVIPLVAPD